MYFLKYIYKTKEKNLIENYRKAISGLIHFENEYGFEFSGICRKIKMTINLNDTNLANTILQIFI